MKGFGGVVSFLVKGDLDAASRVIDRCKVCLLAPSLGGAETLIEQPALMSLYGMTTEERPAAGISCYLIPPAVGLEGVDDAARRNEASPAIIDQAAKNKATVRNSIQSVREGLDKLEIDFRTTPELQRYYIKLAGVASGAANAEDQAAANQFDKAGRTLLEVVNRLTDVLLEMH